MLIIYKFSIYGNAIKKIILVKIKINYDSSNEILNTLCHLVT